MSINLSAFAGAGAQFFDANGAPLTGGLLYTYAAGTTTPATTYTTRDGTANNTNPIVLDAAGRTPAEIWLDGGVLYKFVNNKCKYTNPSDRRLKRDIHHIATLNNGIKIYAFKYLKTDKVYVGVMAQDLLKNPLWKKAVIKQENGFYFVNYAMLGLRMTTFTEWKNKGAAVIQLEKYTSQYEKPRLEVLNFQYLNIHS